MSVAGGRTKRTSAPALPPPHAHKATRATPWERGNVAWLFLAPALLLITIFFFLPVAAALLLSFSAAAAAMTQVAAGHLASAFPAVAAAPVLERIGGAVLALALTAANVAGARVAGRTLGRESHAPNPMETTDWFERDLAGAAAELGRGDAAASRAVPGAGSVIVIVATDAPLLPDQCRALARRVPLGLARTGTTGS